MGSYVQVIVGGLLLLTAFLFGRHINGKPITFSKSQDPATVENQPLNLHGSANSSNSGAPSPTVDMTANSLQRSLRDRILGERNNDKLRVPNTDSTTAANPDDDQDFKKSNPFSLAENDIVIPDFSHLEQSNSSLPVQRPQTPATDLLPERHAETHLGQILSNGVVLGPVPGNPSGRQRPDRADADSRSGIALPDSRKAASSTAVPSQLEHSRDQELITHRGALKMPHPHGQLVPVNHRQNEQAPQADEFVSYTTVFGDTLHGLSNRFFGKPDYYLDIYLANRELFENPSKVPVNTALRIPVMSELVGSRK